MIWDCFLFFDEFDLLDIRLHELADVVDRFVLLESPRTFTNKPKPLYFQEYEGDRFDEFRDRIEVMTLPCDGVENIEFGNPWKMEAYHRNYLLGQLDYSVDDLVLLSDVDEIPGTTFVSHAADGLANSNTYHFLRGAQTLCWYWLNCVRSDPWVAGTRAATGKALRETQISGEELRKNIISCPIARGRGWHFSYMGDIQKKLASFAHTELDRSPYNTPEHIARCKENQEDLFGAEARHGPMRIVDDLSFLPRYVQDNPEKFRHLFYEPEEKVIDANAS